MKSTSDATIRMADHCNDTPLLLNSIRNATPFDIFNRCVLICIHNSITVALILSKKQTIFTHFIFTITENAIVTRFSKTQWFDRNRFDNTFYTFAVVITFCNNSNGLDDVASHDDSSDANSRNLNKHINKQLIVFIPIESHHSMELTHRAILPMFSFLQILKSESKISLI